MSGAVYYYECKQCSRSDGRKPVERPKRTPFWHPIYIAHDCLCNECFKKLFPYGQKEIKFDITKHRELKEREQKLSSEFKQRMFIEIDNAMVKFIEGYNPINTDKNLLRFIRKKRGGVAQFVHDRKNFFEQRVFELLNNENFLALETEYNKEHARIKALFDTFIDFWGDTSQPYYKKTEVTHSETREKMIFWHKVAKLPPEHCYNYIENDIVSSTLFVHRFITNNRDFWAAVTKKLSDAIKETGGYEVLENLPVK